MSNIEKIIEGIDTVSVAIDKYNKMCDELIVNLTVNGDSLNFIKYNNDFFSVNIEKENVIILNDISDLNILKSSNQLLTGFYYKIPYQTVFTIPNTTTTITGSTEEFLILATSENTLSNDVINLTYPNETIFLDSTNSRILYRENKEKNIKTPFDFRTIKFRRWRLEYSGYTNWSSNTLYNYGDIKIYNSIPYINIIQHTSSNSFDNTFWTILPTGYTSYSVSGFNILGTNIPVKINDFQDYYSIDMNNYSSLYNIVINTDCSPSYFNIPNIVINGVNNNIYIDNNSTNITIYNSTGITVETNSSNIYLYNSNKNDIMNSSNIILNNSNNNSLIFTNNIILNSSNDNNLINTQYLSLNNSTTNVLINDEYSVFSNFITNIVFSSEFIKTIGNNRNNIIYSDCDYLTIKNSVNNLFYQGVNNSYVEGSFNVLYQNVSNVTFKGNHNIFWGNNSFITSNTGKTLNYCQFGLNVSNFNINTGSTASVSNLLISLPNKDLTIVNLTTSLNTKNYIIPTTLTGITYSLWYPQIDTDGIITYPLTNLF